MFINQLSVATLEYATQRKLTRHYKMRDEPFSKINNFIIAAIIAYLYYF